MSRSPLHVPDRQPGTGRRGLLGGTLALLGAALASDVAADKTNREKRRDRRKQRRSKRRSKVMICHQGTTIRVSPGVAKAHVSHGDAEGACELGAPISTCTCCPGNQTYFGEADLCCSPGQVPVAGACCPVEHICNDNQGQEVCCPHQCLAGVCCPCDYIANVQQCVVDDGQNPPQATCQNYCE